MQWAYVDAEIYPHFSWSPVACGSTGRMLTERGCNLLLSGLWLLFWFGSVSVWSYSKPACKDYTSMPFVELFGRAYSCPSEVKLFVF